MQCKREYEMQCKRELREYEVAKKEYVEDIMKNNKVQYSGERTNIMKNKMGTALSLSLSHSHSYPKTRSPSLRIFPRLVITVCCVSLTPKSFSLATTHSTSLIFLSTPLCTD